MPATARSGVARNLQQCGHPKTWLAGDADDTHSRYIVAEVVA
jgi:hypothetical protein